MRREAKGYWLNFCRLKGSYTITGYLVINKQGSISLSDAPGGLKVLPTGGREENMNALDSVLLSEILEVSNGVTTA